MSNKILGNEIFSNDGRENIHAATLNAVTPESGMSLVLFFSETRTGIRNIPSRSFVPRLPVGEFAPLARIFHEKMFNNILNCIYTSVIIRLTETHLF